MNVVFGTFQVEEKKIKRYQFINSFSLYVKINILCVQTRFNRKYYFPNYFDNEKYVCDVNYQLKQLLVRIILEAGFCECDNKKMNDSKRKILNESFNN